MNSNNYYQEGNPKENFLQKQQSYDITAEIYSVSSINTTKRLSRERLGMFLALIATFFLSLNCFYAKVILKTFPNDFDSIEFLFMRGLSIIIYGLFQTYYSKQKILKINELPLRFWFLFFNLQIFNQRLIFARFNSSNNNFIIATFSITFKSFFSKRAIILALFSRRYNVYRGVYDNNFKRKKIVK